MRVFFGGAEKGSHRRILEKADVIRFGVNLTHFPIPKTKELVLSEVFTGETLIYTSENDEDINRFDDFLRQHEHNITTVIGRPDYDGTWLGDKYIPVWSDGEDLERLAFLCQRYGRVAISDKAINGKNIPRIRSLSQRWGAHLYGLTSKPDSIEALLGTPWSLAHGLASCAMARPKCGMVMVYGGTQPSRKTPLARSIAPILRASD